MGVLLLLIGAAASAQTIATRSFDELSALTANPQVRQLVLQVTRDRSGMAFRSFEKVYSARRGWRSRYEIVFQTATHYRISETDDDQFAALFTRCKARVDVVGMIDEHRACEVNELPRDYRVQLIDDSPEELICAEVIQAESVTEGAE